MHVTARSGKSHPAGSFDAKSAQLACANAVTSERSHLRSWIASTVQLPSRKLPFSVPRGAPGLRPPCKRHRVRPRIAGLWHAPPARVRAPHRAARLTFWRRLLVYGVVRNFFLAPYDDLAALRICSHCLFQSVHTLQKGEDCLSIVGAVASKWKVLVTYRRVSGPVLGKPSSPAGRANLRPCLAHSRSRVSRGRSPKLTQTSLPGPRAKYSRPTC